MHERDASTFTSDPLNALIERRPWSAFRLSMLIICFSVTLMDGVHQLSMAVAGPAVAQDMALSPTGLGFLMGASEFGFMLGALALSPLTDRFGRKRMLLLSTLAFGLFSIATAFADSLPTLLIARLLTGVGLGCAGPAVVSLATEYAPVHHRARMATLIWAANPAGCFASGMFGGMIIAHFDWRTFFIGAGGLTMLFVVLIAAFVPESLRFMLARAPADPRVLKILGKLGADDVRSIVEDPRLQRHAAPQGLPVRLLFEGPTRGFTIALWAAFFLSFLCLMAALTWTVAILTRAGLGIETAAIVLAINNVGGVIGVASAGWAMERLGGPKLLVATFLIGVLVVLGMGQFLHNLPVLMILSGLIGLFIGGNTAGLIALAAERYPTMVRATGLGWALAAGRLGGSTGPVLMGVVAEMGASPKGLFAAIAVPAAIGTLVALPLCRRERRTSYGADSPA